MRIPLNGKMNRLHEFEDRMLEQEYQRAQIIQSLAYMRMLSFSLGILFFLFIIADYITNSNAATILFILANRTLVCLAAFGLYWVLSVSKRYELFFFLYNLVFFITAILLCFICVSYESPNFMIQTMGLMVLMLVAFMITNRWVSKVASSILIAVAFFIITSLAHSDLRSNELAAAIVFTTLVLVLRAVSTYKNEAQRRMLYLNGRQLEILSKTDSMTGLFNRDTLQCDLSRRIAEAESAGDDFGIVLFDIDDFKIINDTYGHLAGDKVLLEIVGQIKGLLQEEYSMYRWGGEEFIILFPGFSQDSCIEFSDKFCRTIDELIFEESIRVTCSFGIACYSKGDTVQTMLDRADKNLYVAKSSGKNCVAIDGAKCVI